MSNSKVNKHVYKFQIDIFYWFYLKAVWKKRISENLTEDSYWYFASKRRFAWHCQSASYSHLALRDGLTLSDSVTSQKQFASFFWHIVFKRNVMIMIVKSEKNIEVKLNRRSLVRIVERWKLWNMYIKALALRVFRPITQLHKKKKKKKFCASE